MKYSSLTDAMLYLLESSGTGLSDKQIADQIEAQKLWMRPSDGKYPDESQIRRRASHTPFSVSRGIISLQPVAVDNYARLCRITHNEEQWHKPSEHEWREKYQGNSEKAFENQYGFGGEEWLFNPVFLFDGYQYGVIRGLEDLPKRITLVPQVYLYSLDQVSKKRYFVGTIKNVEIFQSDSKDYITAQKLWNAYKKQMTADIFEASGDPEGLKLIRPSIRFLPEDVTFLNPILEVEAFKQKKYNRFIPKKVTASIKELLEELLPEDRLNIKAGKAKTSEKHTRSTQKTETTIERLHSDITDTLYDYLNKYEDKHKTLSVELTRFGSNIADGVLEYSNGSISIFEAKTSGNLRRNLREAIGQLMDYAFWYNSPPIKSLVIISPIQLSGNSLEAFYRLKKSISVSIEYWQYVSGVPLKSAFVKIT
jgi:hypothetical protein